jgi:membrane-bound serine protease (ClpP class)
MEGATARVTEWADGEGAVWVHGERWQARGPHALAVGDNVRITALEGLTLIVTETAPGHDPLKG